MLHGRPRTALKHITIGPDAPVGLEQEFGVCRSPKLDYLLSDHEVPHHVYLRNEGADKPAKRTSLFDDR